MDIMSYLLGQNSGAKKGMKVIVVDELPTTGEANVLYLVPKQDTGDNDIFEEWLYVEEDWEKIGTTDIDLSNYYTKDETIAKVTSIPTASIDYLGKVMMYIGQTGTYTNGRFYICVSDGEQTPTYSWVELEVQTIPEYTIPLEVFDLTTSSSSNDIITALGGNDNIIKLREAFKNNKEINAIKKQTSGSTTSTTTISIKYDYANMYDINEIIKLEAVYTDTSSTTDYKRHFIALTGSSGTWSVTNTSVTDIATTELTGLLANLQTTSKTNLVSAINELASSGSPIEVIEDNFGSVSTTRFDNISSLKNAHGVNSANKLYLLKNTYSSEPGFIGFLFCTYLVSNSYTRQNLLIIKAGSNYVMTRTLDANGNLLGYDNFSSAYVELYTSTVALSNSKRVVKATEIVSWFGTKKISDLTTTTKTSLVDAINEVNTKINNLVDANNTSY